LRDITHESLGLPPLAPANPFKKWLTENFNCSLRSFSEIERNQIFPTVFNPFFSGLVYLIAKEISAVQAFSPFTVAITETFLT